ncbi:MAG: gliding motility lipoprotein GldH [Bacteroidales bacterium]|nr:gliding motility lipoprotein GldH [Bacteroidales bacterium]
MFLLVLAVVITSCNDNAYYEEIKPVEGELWDMRDIKEFSVNVDNSEASYRLIFTVRNTTDYAYSNLYLFFTTTYPDQEITRDTIECLLADRSGQWLGKGVGKIRESRFLIKDRMNFPDTGNYIFTLEQAMRDETLPGIADIGIRIENIAQAE